MVKRRAVVVFSMVVVALIAAGCVSSAPGSASHTIAPKPTSNTIKTDGLYRAKTDAPICETHDELVTAAYEYDGGHTPDVSGCTALANGEEVKSLGSQSRRRSQRGSGQHAGPYWLDEVLLPRRVGSEIELTTQWLSEIVRPS